MTIAIIKKSTIAALAVATIATTSTFASIDTAEAGSKKFWKGFGAGVVTGIVVNGAINNGHAHGGSHHGHSHGSTYSQWDAHVDWCYDYKRKYRESDNTWRPYGKPRRECYSPHYN